MIKAVLFDFGGVLSKGGKRDDIRQIFAKIYAIPARDVQLGPFAGQLLRGLISTTSFFAKVNQQHPGLSPASAELFQKYTDIFAKSDPVYRLAATLRKQGIKTAILSNVIALSARQLRSRGFYKEFDPIVLSCEEKVMKPDNLAFYKLALHRVSLPAEQILFIDDQPTCLVPARMLGMQTLLAESPEQIIGDTKELLKAENDLVIL